MMDRQYFDFTDLIMDFSNKFTVIVPQEGGYDEAGDWKAGDVKKKTLTGAIIAFKESKIFRYEGKITAKDKRLFMLEPLPDALIGAEIVYRGEKYTIESELENAEFTGVYSYLLRWVSAFDCV